MKILVKISNHSSSGTYRSQYRYRPGEPKDITASNDDGCVVTVLSDHYSWFVLSDHYRWFVREPCQGWASTESIHIHSATVFVSVF